MAVGGSNPEGGGGVRYRLKGLHGLKEIRLLAFE